ncbi:hypothetical protein [Streptomyces sp. NPDC048508]
MPPGARTPGPARQSGPGLDRWLSWHRRTVLLDAPARLYTAATAQR